MRPFLGTLSFIGGLALSAATPALAEPATSDQQRAALVARAFHEAMVVCPERVWPNYNWRGTTVYFPNMETQAAFAWRADAGAEVQAVAISSLDPHAGLSAFWFDSQQPVMALPLNLTPRRSQDVVDPVLTLGIHEGFHHYAQAGWHSVVRTSRSTVYPLQYRPRYLRYAMARLLKEYLDTGKPLALAQTRGLWDQYEREFSAEATALTPIDQFEGSARYAEFMGSAVGTLGCAASEDELTAFYKKQAYGPSGDIPIYSAADVESYMLGSLAALALRHAPDHQGWEAKVAETQPPLAVLMAGVTPAPAPEFSDKLAEAKNLIAAANRDLAAVIEPYREATQSSAYRPVSLEMNQERWQNSFELKSFVIDQATSWDLWLGFGTKVSARDHQGMIELKGVTILNGSSPCAPDALTFYTRTDAIEFAGDQHLSLHSQGVDADRVAYKTATGVDGKQWICL